MTKYIVDGFSMVGDSHRYKSKKGEISLVYPSMFTMNCFEIYCIKGNLFSDVERFVSLAEAEQRIKELL